jgi:hypothetical protein
MILNAPLSNCAMAIRTDGTYTPGHLEKPGFSGFHACRTKAIWH